MALKLTDLIAQEARLKLSTRETEIVLKPWSLRVRFWALDKYGAERLQEILKTHSLFELCEIAFFMMTDESRAMFKNFDEFTESVVQTSDILAISTALLQTIGVSEPMIEDIRKEMHERETGSPELPKQKPQPKKKTKKK